MIYHILEVEKTQKIELFHVDLAIKNEDLPADLTVIQ